LRRDRLNEDIADIQERLHDFAQKEAPAYGSANKVFTQEGYESAKKTLGEQRLTMGLDADKMKALIYAAGYHVEALLREAGRVMHRTWMERMRLDFPEASDKDLRRAWKATKESRSRVLSVWKSEKKAATKSALPSAVKKRLLAQAKAGRIGGESITLTPRKLLQVTMRKAEIHSAKAYLAAARETTETHVDLARYARDRLKGANLTDAQHNRVLKVLSRARTPAEQRAVVAAVDMMADIADRREAWAYFQKAKKSIDIKHMRPEFQSRARALLDSFTETVPAQDTLAGLDELIEASEVDPDNVVLAALARRARKVVSRSGQVALRKLPAETVRDIADALLDLSKQNELKNKLIVRGEVRQAEEVADELAGHIRSRFGAPRKPSLAQADIPPKPAGPLSRFVLDHDKPETVVLSMTGSEDPGAYNVLWEQPHEGYDKRLRIVQEAEDVLREPAEAAGLWKDPRALQKWSFDAGKKKAELLPIALPSARVGNKSLKTIHLTRAERMNFYCNSKDVHTHRHVVKGVPVTFGHAETTQVVLKEADIRAINESLSAEERAICDAALGYINGTLLNKHLNPAWMDEHGHNLVRRQTDRTYYPNQRSRLFRQRNQPTAIQYMGRMVLDRMGIFKERTGGEVPIVIDDFFTVYFGHINKVASYAGFSMALRRARSLMDHPKVKVALREANQGRLQGYLQKYLTDVEGLEQVDVAPHLGALKWLRRQQYLANLGLNLGTAMKQPVSFSLAGTEISAKHLVEGMRGNPWSTEDIAEITSESAWLRNRFEGSRIGILGPTVQLRPLELFFTGKTSSRLESVMAPIHRGDQAAIVMIWRAARAEGAEQGLEGQELLDYTRTRAEKIIYRTQPVWDTVHQSGLGRRAHTDFLAGVMTLYSSQTNQNWNIWRRAQIKHNANPTAETRAQLAKAAVSLLVAGLMIGGIDELRRWVGRGFKPRRPGKKWGPLDHTMNVVGGLMRMVYGSDFIMGLYEAGKAPTKFTRWERTSPYQQVYEDAQDFVMWTYQAIEKAATQERYVSGKQKGEYKWKVYAGRWAESASRVGMTVFGIPKFPVSVLRGIRRAGGAEVAPEVGQLQKKVSELNKAAQQLALDKKLLPDTGRLQRTRLGRADRLADKAKRPGRAVEIAKAALSGKPIFETLKPEGYAEVVAAHVELYEQRAEAYAVGQGVDQKKDLAAHGALERLAVRFGAKVGTARKQALGSMRSQYSGLFGQAIARKDHEAAMRYVRARMGLGVSLGAQRKSVTLRAKLAIAKGIPRATAVAQAKRALKAISEAKNPSTSPRKEGE
ncbi:MAG TPA: hypothetical protein VNA25_28810, partial [Phycisphaerae bacterium]|nr:hypothetical protein [Phycisphaerae bacterium]